MKKRLTIGAEHRNALIRVPADRQTCSLRLSALCALMAAALSPLAAASRCELAAITDSSGARQCFDPSSIQGEVLEFPASVTRLGVDALTLCPQSDTTTDNADIVYILDQTGSMQCSGAEILPTGDTIYTYKPSECTTAVQGTITIPSGDTTQTIPLYQGCPLTRESGDPFGQRVIALDGAISWQARRAPRSTAGIIEFCDTIISARPLQSLDSNGAAAALTAGIVLKGYNGTNYLDPLVEAKRWLSDSTMAPHRKKAIVFISDGTPDQINYLNVLNASFAQAPGIMPPIYGIFLGNPTSQSQPLADLANLTGGTFYSIPPDRPDSLSGVMRAILDHVLLQSVASVQISNTSVNPPQTSQSIGFDTLAGGGVATHLNDVIGLALGRNQMIMIVGSADGTQDTIHFAAEVGDSACAACISGLQFFSQHCSPVSALTALNARGIAGGALLSSDSLFTVQLTTAAPLYQPSQIAITTVRSHDLESAYLPPGGSAGATVNVSAAVRLDSAMARPGDSVVQVVANDTIHLRWMHPRDARDTAVATVVIAPDTVGPIGPIVITAAPVPFAPALPVTDPLGTLAISITSPSGILKGTITIYDEVGNVVHRELLTQQPASSLPYVVRWDGRNQSNRIVGSGSYLVVVVVDSATGLSATKKIMVGVKR